MRSLVVYYSRSGNTRQVAEHLAGLLGADIEAIVPKRLRFGRAGYFRCLFEAIGRRPADIVASSNNPAKYDLVVIGTPVWAWTVSSPVRAWLRRHRDNVRKAAFFCTRGGAGEARAFRHMERELGQPAVATCAVFEHQVHVDTYKAPMNEFAKKLGAGAATPTDTKAAAE